MAMDLDVFIRLILVKLLVKKKKPKELSSKKLVKVSFCIGLVVQETVLQYAIIVPCSSFFLEFRYIYGIL